MRVGQEPTSLGGRLGRQVSCALFMGFIVLSMGMRDCEEGNTGFVTITSPDAGAVFSSAQTVTIEATVLEELLSDVSKVEFYDGEMDGPPKCADATGPDYQCAWSVTGTDNGTHGWTARAYLSNGSTIDSKTVELTVDISPGTRGNGPRESGLVGFIPGVGVVNDVAMQGESAYLASAEFGLSVVDARDSSHLRLLGSADVPFSGKAVAVRGERAVVIGEATDGAAHLWALDVSELPPLVMGELELPASAGEIGDVALSADSVAVVALGEEGLVMVDVTDTSAPRVMGNYDTPGSANGVQLGASGELAYVADGSGDLQIVNLSNPETPSLESSLSLAGGMVDVALAATQRVLYLADGAGSIWRVDVSVPGSPQPMARQVLGGSPTRVAVQDDGVQTRVAVLMGTAHQGQLLQMADASDPYNLQLSDTAAVGPLGTDGGLALSGGRAYVAAGSGGVQVFGTFTGSPVLADALSNDFEPKVLDVAAGRALVLGEYLPEGRAHLKVIDVTVPWNPRVVGELPLSAEADPRYLDVEIHQSGQWAVVGLGYAGIHVLDLSDPAAPRVQGVYDTPDFVFGVALQANGSRVYVADGFAGLKVVSLADRGAPSLEGSAFVGAVLRDVAVAEGEGRVYAAAQLGALNIFDVSTPSNPWMIGGRNVGAVPFRVDVEESPEGTRVAMLTGTATEDLLQILDTTNPYFPRPMGSVVLGPAGTGEGIDLNAGRVYVAARGAGLQIFDLDESGAPSLTADGPVVGPLNAVVVRGSYAYAADSASVISIFEADAL